MLFIYILDFFLCHLSQFGLRVAYKIRLEIHKMQNKTTQNNTDGGSSSNLPLAKGGGAEERSMSDYFRTTATRNQKPSGTSLPYRPCRIEEDPAEYKCYLTEHSTMLHSWTSRLPPVWTNRLPLGWGPPPSSYCLSVKTTLLTETHDGFKEVSNIVTRTSINNAIGLVRNGLWKLKPSKNLKQAKYKY